MGTQAMASVDDFARPPGVSDILPTKPDFKPCIRPSGAARPLGAAAYSGRSSDRLCGEQFFLLRLDKSRFGHVECGGTLTVQGPRQNPRPAAVVCHKTFVKCVDQPSETSAESRGEQNQHHRLQIAIIRRIMPVSD